MPTIAEQLTQLESDRQDLVSNLQTKGITGLTGDETFTALVPEVLNIPTATLQSKTVSAGTNLTVVNPDYGYDGLSQVTINPVTASIDANIQARNIKKDVVILGVTGTFEGGGGADLDRVVEGTVITITSGATQIRQMAFRGCSSLTTATFTAVTLYSIGATAFYDTMLNSLTIHSNSVPTLASVNAFPSSPVSVFVPSNLIASYQTATNWSQLYSDHRVTFYAIT